MKLKGVRATDTEIVFQYADGSIETIRTAVDGTANVKRTPPPVMATALLEYDTLVAPITWMGVENGDVLLLDTGLGSATIGAYEAVMPPTMGLTDDVRFDVGAGCFWDQKAPSGTGPFVLPVNADCTPDGSYALLALEKNGDMAVGYTYQKGLASPSPEGVPVTLGAWSSPSSVTVSVPHAAELVEPWATLDQLVGGRSFDGRSRAVTGGSAVFPVAPGFADAYLVSVIHEGATREQQQRTTARQSATTTMTIDAGSKLPWLADATIDGDGDAPDVHWTGDTQATTGGGIHVSYRPKHTTRGGLWTVIVPPGTTRVRLPKLPGDAVSFQPRSGLDAYHLSAVSFFSVPDRTPAQFRTGIGIAKLAWTTLSAAVADTLPGDGTSLATEYLAY